MPEHNAVLLDERHMKHALAYLSVRLFKRFGTTVRLVIHGGAVMVLHHKLSRKRSTPDVDYLHRAFVSEWTKRGVHDAGERLTACIVETARACGLGDDWMNSHADIALPMARDMYGNLTDPIYNDAMKQTNMCMNTVFESPGLILIGVSWSWAVALKLVRYQKDDPEDIAAILSLGTQLRGCHWTQQLLEGWLLNLCGPMGYSHYPPHEIKKTRARMQDAISRVKNLPWDQSSSTVPKSQAAPMLVSYYFVQQQAQLPRLHHPTRPATVHEGDIDHEKRKRERLSDSRSRTRSFTAPSSAPMPPLPRVPMPTPIAPPPNPARLTSRSRHPSVSVAAAVPPTSVPLPPSTTSSQLSSRKSSFMSIPTPQPKPIPHVYSRSSSHAVPTSVLHSLPRGFVPAYWHPHPHALQRVGMA